MKALLIPMLALCAAPLAFAAEAPSNAPDTMRTLFECTRVPMVPDAGLEVVVRTGGFAGVTIAEIRNFFLGRSTAETFLIRNVNDGRMGVDRFVDTETGGAQFELSIPVVRPQPDGSRPATLVTAEGTTRLSCKR